MFRGFRRCHFFSHRAKRTNHNRNHIYRSHLPDPFYFQVLIFLSFLNFLFATSIICQSCNLFTSPFLALLKVLSVSSVTTTLTPPISFPREHFKYQLRLFTSSIHFLEGGWAGGIQGRVINFLPAQKGRVSINLTQQREGSLTFYCFPGEGQPF